MRLTIHNIQKIGECREWGEWIVTGVASATDRYTLNLCSTNAGDWFAVNISRDSHPSGMKVQFYEVWREGGKRGASSISAEFIKRPENLVRHIIAVLEAER